MSDLHEIMYVSTRHPDLTDSQVLDDIVLPASRVNRDLDITGCIWFDSFRFVQILEGPHDAVQTIYAKILQDDRHSDIETLHDSPLAARSFQRWGMRALRHPEEGTIDEVLRMYAPEYSGNLEAEGSPRQGLINSVRNLLSRRATTEPPVSPE